MKKVLEIENIGRVTYEESIWTGKKNISIDDKPLEKTSKTTFKMPDGRVIEAQGNFVIGATLKLENQTYEIFPSAKWYEYIMTFLPLILICVWGNLVYLCKIVPVVGGAIGGLISGLMSCLNLFLIKIVKPIWLKILIAIGITGLTFLICFLIALLILKIA